MQLTDAEREHIRLVEEYRAEVRAALEPAPPRESLLGKLVAPLILLIATAVISGLVVPFILGRVEDNRRALELQSRLIEQIVGDDSAAQLSLAAFRNQTRNFRANLLEVELDRRLLQLQPLDAEERAAQRAELRQTGERERSAYHDVYEAMLGNISKALIEQRGNTEWVRLHYGSSPQLDRYIQVTQRDYAAAIRRAVEYQKTMGQIADRTKPALRTCADEAACEAIFRKAYAEMEQPHAPLDYKEWDDARRELVTFISRTRPRI